MSKDNNSVSAKKAKTKGQGSRYIYRGICAVILTVLATMSFMLVWLDYVNNQNNNTKRLLGMGNIAMSAIIYIMMFISYFFFKII